MIPLVIGTHPERPMWLDDCLASINATSSPKREIFIHETGGYEPAAILSGCIRFDTFLYLQDSVTILHKDFWQVVDNSGPAWLAGWPPMFLAIYNSADVQPLMPTHAVSKHEACTLEGHLPTILHMPTIWPDITDQNRLRMEHRHGRENMVLGNSMFEKHKGYWGQ